MCGKLYKLEWKEFGRIARGQERKGVIEIMKY